MQLTEAEERLIQVYRKVKHHGYGRLEVRIEGRRGTFIREVNDHKIEKLNDAEN